MSELRHRRHWSFVRPTHSKAFPFEEALLVVCVVMVLAFLPFRYAVKRPAAAPLRSDGICQLGRELSAANAESIDLRDPAGVLNSDGRSGYLSCLSPIAKPSLPEAESFSFARHARKEVAFQPLPEKSVSPQPPRMERGIETLPELANGVMISESGRKLGEIAIPPQIRSLGGKTVIRLAGGKDFPRSELLASCGRKELDKLALRRSRKLTQGEAAIIVVLWPRQNLGGGK